MKKILIEEILKTPVEEQKLEIVERKGQGHPDYLIDACSEAVSVALSRYYIKNFHKIFHHNVDKGLLVAGSAVPRFGGGEVTQPITIIVAGRATTKVKSEEIPLEEIVPNAIKDKLRKLVRFLDVEKHVNVEYKIRPGSADLVSVFESKGEIPLANDTSVGLAFAPLTVTEKLTYETERFLNSKDFKKRYPMVGEDIKIMSLRRKNKIKLTISMPQVDRFVNSVQEYKTTKEEVAKEVFEFIYPKLAGMTVDVSINTADNEKKGIVYLTVTGTSAESGDDGNTGRGNRINGLITPNRPMSMEATAGKNPVNHVGKIYNVLAYIVSKRIAEEVEGVREVYVKLLSSIGKPINDPQVVSVQIVRKKGYNFETITKRTRRIIDEELLRVTKITDLVLNGKVLLF